MADEKRGARETVRCPAISPDGYGCILERGHEEHGASLHASSYGQWSDRAPEGSTPSESAVQALLPCPMCGGKAALYVSRHKRVKVFCILCGVQTEDQDHRPVAVKFWNRRAAPQEQQDVEVLDLEGIRKRCEAATLGPSEAFEARAERFYVATGMMAPGKDAGTVPVDRDLRDGEWKRWLEHDRWERHQQANEDREALLAEVERLRARTEGEGER